jgi:hypothetical protein
LEAGPWREAIVAVCVFSWLEILAGSGSPKRGGWKKLVGLGGWINRTISRGDFSFLVAKAEKRKSQEMIGAHMTLPAGDAKSGCFKERRAVLAKISMNREDLGLSSIRLAAAMW